MRRSRCHSSSTSTTTPRINATQLTKGRKSSKKPPSLTTATTGTTTPKTKSRLITNHILLGGFFPPCATTATHDTLSKQLEELQWHYHHHTRTHTRICLQRPPGMDRRWPVVLFRVSRWPCRACGQGQDGLWGCQPGYGTMLASSMTLETFRASLLTTVVACFPADVTLSCAGHRSAIGGCKLIHTTCLIRNFG